MHSAHCLCKNRETSPQLLCMFVIYLFFFKPSIKSEFNSFWTYFWKRRRSFRPLGGCFPPQHLMNSYGLALLGDELSTSAMSYLLERVTVYHTNMAERHFTRHLVNKRSHLSPRNLQLWGGLSRSLRCGNNVKLASVTECNSVHVISNTVLEYNFEKLALYVSVTIFCCFVLKLFYIYVETLVTSYFACRTRAKVTQFEQTLIYS